ncbi:uncharacterized protein LOC143566262 [Bidens hawaiensis]|uniref:uncharacterized protein LOC143566262 n=1 Tax=Bidens hawaiensis TaxID=980011 RepID=UPI004049EB38
MKSKTTIAADTYLHVKHHGGFFSYDIHYRTPSVIRLPFHLPGQQQVIYEAFDDLDDILDKPSVASSMFSEWFKCNQKYPETRTLTLNFLQSLFGKLTNVIGNQGNLGFPLVKGPTTFAQIRTVNSVKYPTFRDACYACGLLDDDNEYVEAIVEASFIGTGYYLRSLFCTLLMSESMSRPEFVWETTWTYLSDDILYRQRIVLKHSELNDEQLKNLTLFEIEKFLLRNNFTLKKFFTMHFSNKDSISSANNILLSEELSYDKVMLAQEFEQLFSSFTDEQHSVYEEIIEAVDKNKSGETQMFAQWFLDIGEGNAGGTNDEKDYFHERAILAPKNDIVQEINDRLLSIFPGEEREYLNSDSVCPTDMINENLDESLCSPDILNGIKASGLPNHKLVLKAGVPVMLLRNIDQKSGLCNGTRLKVVSLGKRIIRVEIISGSNIGDKHYIPRITLIRTDKKLHIKLQRRQYPLALCFAMTINKSQGKSLSRVGLYLKKPVFTHG